MKIEERLLDYKPQFACGECLQQNEVDGTKNDISKLTENIESQPDSTQ